MKDKVSHATRASHAGGLRFAAEVRGHVLVTDQTEAGGGSNAHATPLELLGAALATCAALYVHRFLEARGLPTEGLSVEVDTAMADEGPKRITRFLARVSLPAGVPEAVSPLVERVVRSCPVHNTLTHGPATVDVHLG
jgi:putative redox protein